MPVYNSMIPEVIKMVSGTLALKNGIKNGYRQDCPKKAISAGQNRNLFVFAANLRFLRLLEN